MNRRPFGTAGEVKENVHQSGAILVVEDDPPVREMLALLLSITAISVLSWFTAASDLLKSFGCGMGHSVGCRATIVPALGRTALIQAPSSAGSVSSVVTWHTPCPEAFVGNDQGSTRPSTDCGSRLAGFPGYPAQGRT
jgi:hypothetical protein